ncbi:MAG: hypothetical protein J6M14_04180 [Campylobacter sp.]|nr:hypothetical protein [Campylobacter sp.]
MIYGNYRMDYWSCIISFIFLFLKILERYIRHFSFCAICYGIFIGTKTYLETPHDSIKVPILCVVLFLLICILFLGIVSMYNEINNLKELCNQQQEKITELEKQVENEYYPENNDTDDFIKGTGKKVAQGLAAKAIIGTGGAILAALFGDA